MTSYCHNWKASFRCELCSCLGRRTPDVQFALVAGEFILDEWRSRLLHPVLTLKS